MRAGFLRIRLGTTRPFASSDGVWLHKRAGAAGRFPSTETGSTPRPECHRRVSPAGWQPIPGSHWSRIQPDVKVCLPDSSMAQPMLACAPGTGRWVVVDSPADAGVRSRNTDTLEAISASSHP